MPVFDGLQRHFYGAVLADPPWRFRTYDNREVIETRERGATHYRTMIIEEIRALPVATLAADDCVLFLWVTWPNLLECLSVIEPWGFEYKTCAFAWMKAHADQIDLFRDDLDGQMGNGYWTRANSEVCLLATRGNPKRLNADVRQAIIEPRREHSRKPACVRERIERLVAGPYVELFARSRRAGWDAWGNEVGKFDPMPQHKRPLCPGWPGCGCGTQSGPHHCEYQAECERRYRKLGIDPAGPFDPDGSDYHLMNAVDDEVCREWNARRQA